MSIEELNKVLEELHAVRPEMLNGESKRLFEAIMQIVDERDEAKAGLYTANCTISDYIDITKKQDKMIDLILEEFAKDGACPYSEYDYDYDLDCENRCEGDIEKECWKKYFERKVEENE